MNWIIIILILVFGGSLNANEIDFDSVWKTIQYKESGRRAILYQSVLTSQLKKSKPIDSVRVARKG